MLEILRQVIGDSPQKSKDTAKDRLRLVLLHDRAASIPPDVLNKLREELIACITKYLDIDESNLDVSLNRNDESVALVANIPVRNVRKKQ